MVELKKHAQILSIGVIIATVIFLGVSGSTFAQTPQSPDDIAKSLSCIPPGTIGCTDQLSRIRFIDTLQSAGILNSDVGAIELTACAQSMNIYQQNLDRYNSCPADQKVPLGQEDAARNTLLPLLCSPILGGHGQYNPNLKSCECTAGYFLYENECVSPTAICQQKYGSDIQSTNGNCTCPTGLVWNTDHTACATPNVAIYSAAPTPHSTPKPAPTDEANISATPRPSPTKEPAQSLRFVRTSPTPTPTASANPSPSQNGILQFIINIFNSFLKLF